MRIVAALLVALAAGLSPVTAAGVLPDGFTPPAGFVVDEKPSRFFDFDHLSVTVPRPGGGGSDHLEIEGRTWRLFLKVTPPNRTSDATDVAMRASLAAQGWEILTKSGLLVARLTDPATKNVRWWSGSAESGYYRAVVTEAGGTPKVLTLSPPARAPERIGDTEDFPYVGRFPGAVLVRTEQRKDDSIDATPPGVSEKTIAGPPVVKKYYSLSPTTSTYEFMVSYRDALLKAGWAIVRAASGGDVSVIAHFTKNGRDVYCSLHGDWAAVADVGAQSETARLSQLLASDGHVPIPGIYFDVDKATLKAESETALGHILSLLRENPGLRIEIQGHTDDTGNAPHNQRLSEERAASVERWLVDHEVAAARLRPAGFGATRPVAPNATPEGRAKNRRVEIAKR